MSELDKYSFLGFPVSMGSLRELLPAIAVRVKDPNILLKKNRKSVHFASDQNYFLGHAYDGNKLEYDLDFVRHAISLTPMERSSMLDVEDRFFTLHDAKMWLEGDIQLARDFIAAGFLTDLLKRTSKSSYYDFWPTTRFKEVLEDVNRIIHYDNFVKPSKDKHSMGIPDLFEDGTSVSL